MLNFPHSFHQPVIHSSPYKMPVSKWVDFDIRAWHFLLFVWDKMWFWDVFWGFKDLQHSHSGEITMLLKPYMKWNAPAHEMYIYLSPQVKYMATAFKNLISILWVIYKFQISETDNCSNKYYKAFNMQDRVKPPGFFSCS